MRGVNKFVILFVIMFNLIYLINVNAAEKDICTGAMICSDYDIDCNMTKDSFCPENYGDWSKCEEQNYGGKCFPCDPDCGTCGNITLLTKSKANPCEKIPITITAELRKIPDMIKLMKGPNINSPVIGTSLCSDTTENPCTRKFDYTVSCIGGDDEVLTATTTNLQQSGIKVTKSIEINPNVSISIIPDRDPASGVVKIKVNVKSTKGVTKSEVYLYKKDIKSNKFRPVTADINNPNYCSFRCVGEKCNLFGTQITEIYPLPENADFTFTWDTRKCDNKEFKLEAVGYDNRNNLNNANLTVKTDNENAPCVDQCYPFNSELLNTVYIKIKSWVS